MGDLVFSQSKKNESLNKEGAVLGFDYIFKVCVFCFVASEPFHCTWTISSYLLCHMGKTPVFFTQEKYNST